MRKLVSVALFLGFSLLVGSASAFHNGPCHGNQCDGANSANLAVKDSISAQVGTFMGVRNPWKVVVQLGFKDSTSTLRLVPACVTEVEIQDCFSGVTVWFDGANCTKQAWVTAATARSFPPTFELSAIVVDGEDPDVRVLYVPSDDVEMASVSESKATATGCVSPAVETFSGFRAEVLVGDLHQVYLPPFALEAQ